MAPGGVHALVVRGDEDDCRGFEVVEDFVLEVLVVDVDCADVLEVQAPGEGVIPRSGPLSPTPSATTEVAAANPAASTSATASARRITASSGSPR